MINPVEIAIGTIAPHRCVVCRQEGNLLCASCRETAFILPPSRCYRCHKATIQNRVCDACRRRSGLLHAWVASEYEDVAKKLVHKLKFDRARTAASVLAEAIADALPILPDSVIVTNIPTANNRVRMRGYDQARLIAKELAKSRDWTYADLLFRIGSSRQVGSSREVRLTQIKNAFRPQKQRAVRGSQILLVDDVLTTGATIEAAAKVLKKAGARTVDAVVFTQPID